MNKFFLVLTVAIVLTACSTSASNNAGNSRRTPIAQIQAPSASQSQSTATDQPLATDTPTVTLVPATPTVSPVASVTPAATADSSQPTGLDVLSSQGYAMNDGFYIVGELLNNTSTPMGNIKITATYYYQRAGKPVTLGTLDGATLLDVIPAYSKAPFLIGPYVVTVTNAGPVTWYDLHEDGQTATLPRQDLIVLPTTNSYSTGNWLYVRGEIQNTGKTDAKFVKAIITLYDPNGNIVGAISTYTNPSTIPAGGNAPFTASTEYWPNFDHFSVQVQAQ